MGFLEAAFEGHHEINSIHAHRSLHLETTYNENRKIIVPFRCRSKWTMFVPETFNFRLKIKNHQKYATTIFMIDDECLLVCL